jgi:hypothetical protein
MEWSGLRVAPRTSVVKGIAQTAVAGTGAPVSVKIMGATIVCRLMRGVTIAVGDIVAGVRVGGEILILGRMHTAAPSAPPDGTGYPPQPEGLSRTGQITFFPVETRSYHTGPGPNGWRFDTDDLLQSEWGGDLFTGCAFYGSAPRSLAGAVVTLARLKMKRVAGGDSSARKPEFYRIAESTRPSGAPTRTGSGTLGPNLSVNEVELFTLPNALAQDIVDGISGGIGIWVADDSQPHVRLAGRGKYSSSMALTIDWNRIS